MGLFPCAASATEIGGADFGRPTKFNCGRNGNMVQRKRELDRRILATLRKQFLLAAGDLALYPAESPEHIRAEHAAANTSRTVFELFGATEAAALREEAIRKWPKLGAATWPRSASGQRDKRKEGQP